jgi:hypothetical protein
MNIIAGCIAAAIAAGPAMAESMDGAYHHSFCQSVSVPDGPLPCQHRRNYFTVVEFGADSSGPAINRFVFDLTDAGDESISFDASVPDENGVGRINNIIIADHNSPRESGHTKDIKADGACNFKPGIDDISCAAWTLQGDYAIKYKAAAP